MKKFRLLATIIFSAFTLQLCSIPTFAESTISVSPMYQSIILRPGEEYHTVVKITNPMNATSDLHYKTSIGSFSQVKTENSKDDYGAVDFDTQSNYNLIMSWIEIDSPTGSVEPNETGIIPITINVPDNAPAGGQYATILVQNDPQYDTNDLDGNLVIESRAQIASIIYAEVTGETIKSGEILENSIPSFITDNKLEAISLVKNTGNVHTDAEYILQVWPIFSEEEICTNEENLTTDFIMPETQKYHSEKCSLPSMGIFRAKQTVKIFGETSIVEKTVIVCPIWLLFIIIFAIFALVFYFVAKAKARKKAEKAA